MAAMDKMLADMLKRLIPQEVLDLLTPEKVKEVTDGINAYIISQREQLDRIEAKSAESFKSMFALMVDMQQQIEELKNERESGSDRSNGRSRKPGSSSGGVAGNSNGGTTGNS